MDGFVVVDGEERARAGGAEEYFAINVAMTGGEVEEAGIDDVEATAEAEEEMCIHRFCVEIIVELDRELS